MHTRGLLAPADDGEVRERYDDLGLAAQVVVKESAKAMDFDVQRTSSDEPTGTSGSGDVRETDVSRASQNAKRSDDAAEYRERVTSDVVATGRDALFASLLRVHVGTREEFDAWLDGRDVEVVVEGNGNVGRVVWHHAPAAGTVLAATFEEEEDAATATLQRIVFGRLYRERL